MAQDVDFSWDAVSDVDGYHLYLKESSESSYSRENSELITNTEYGITQLANGNYDSYVTSMKGGIESNPSNIESFEVLDLQDFSGEETAHVNVSGTGVEDGITVGGWSFIPNKDIVLTHLRYRVRVVSAPQTAEVRVYRRDNGELLASADVTMESQSTYYETDVTNIILNSGVEYIISLHDRTSDYIAYLDDTDSQNSTDMSFEDLLEGNDLNSMPTTTWSGLGVDIVGCDFRYSVL